MPRKPKQTDGRESPTALIARLMERAKCAPISQLFIVEAVRRYAEECAEAKAETLNLGPISGAHWKRCAVEIHEEISKHLGE